MQFRDRDIWNMAIGGVAAGIVCVFGVFFFGLSHHAEGLGLPILGIVSGVIGFICAVLAEYIRRWKALTASVISLAFFLLLMAFGSPDGYVRLFVGIMVGVSALMVVMSSVPQIIVNVMPEAERIRSRLQRVFSNGRSAA